MTVSYSNPNTAKIIIPLPATNTAFMNNIPTYIASTPCSESPKVLVPECPLTAGTIQHPISKIEGRFIVQILNFQYILNAPEVLI